MPYYELADSDSSDDESTSDEDSNSDDEGFIDDKTIAVDEPPDHATGFNGLALSSPACGNTNPIRAEETAKALVAADDKENVEPDASSDVEIVNSPDVGNSNIVDIESMNL